VNQSFATVELFVADQQNERSNVQNDTETTHVSVGFLDRDELQRLDSGVVGWMIIRPDGYLAAAGELDDMGPAMLWLSKIAHP
jgi:hypothetical protein